MALCPVFEPGPLHCQICETAEVVQGQDVSFMRNPQQGGPGYLSLSGIGGSTSNYAATSIDFVVTGAWCKLLHPATYAFKKVGIPSREPSNSVRKDTVILCLLT